MTHRQHRKFKLVLQLLRHRWAIWIMFPKTSNLGSDSSHSQLFKLNLWELWWTKIKDMILTMSIIWERLTVGCHKTFLILMWAWKILSMSSLISIHQLVRSRMSICNWLNTWKKDSSQLIFLMLKLSFSMDLVKFLYLSWWDRAIHKLLRQKIAKYSILKEANIRAFYKWFWAT